MTKNRALATGRINCNNAKELADRLWTTLMVKLNAVSFPHRSVDGWKKIWTDYKFNVRKRWERGAELTKTQEKIVKLANFKKIEEKAMFEHYGEVEDEEEEDCNMIEMIERPASTTTVVEVVVSSDDEYDDSVADEADLNVNSAPTLMNNSTTTTIMMMPKNKKPKIEMSSAAEATDLPSRSNVENSGGCGDEGSDGVSDHGDIMVSMKRKMAEVQKHMETQTKLLRTMSGCLAKRVEVAKRNCRVNEERLEIEKANLEVNNDIKQVLLQLLVKKESES